MLMQQWVISLPAWGRHYVDVCTRWAIPAIKASLECLPGNHAVTFLVHTNEKEPFRRAIGGYPITFMRVPPARNTFEAFGLAHREALAYAPSLSNLILLNADIVVSRETFSMVDRVFDQGARVVATVGTRTLLGPEGAPIGADARTLSEWSWANRHPIARECLFDGGKTHLPTVLFFRNRDNVVEHCFHLCPVAIRVDGRDLKFSGTIDDDLLGRFEESEIFVVKDLECALAELSPANKIFHTAEGLSVEYVARFGYRRFRPRHLWNATHGMLIAGNRDEVNTSVMQEIFDRMNAFRANPPPEQDMARRPHPRRFARTVRA